MSFYPELDRHRKNKIKLESDLFNYATQYHVKKEWFS